MTPPTSPCPDALAARRAFPCGLHQPDRGFRSSVDALLLADFIPTSTRPLHFVELGTGCGMAACALALRLPEARGVGIDSASAAVEAARRNFQALALEDRLHAHVAEVADIPALRALVFAPPHVVMANPPYRAPGAGRPPLHVARKQALVATSETLDIFCAAAFALLPHHGRFCCIFAAARLTELVLALHRHRLGLRRLRAVHTRPNAAAQLILVEARKDCADDLRLEPPLESFAPHTPACSSPAPLQNKTDA